MDILNTARWYVDQGLSVIPIKADGSKSPSIRGWRSFSNEIADDQQLQEWFGGGQVVGIGICPGPASGNMVVLDFENSPDGSAYAQWYDSLPTDLRELVDILPTVLTPSGGRHIWVRLPAPQRGGRLARYESGKTKIEIRGEGHQVLAPGCPADCHPTGKLYEWAIQQDLVEIDEETWLALVYHACECNSYHAPEQPRDYGSTSNPEQEGSPGTDFNLNGTWEETGLFESGWTWAKQIDGQRGFLTRPGKNTGISASIGMISGKAHSWPYLFVWSTSTNFTSETPYSRFAVYAAIKYGGDFRAAATALKEKGYGRQVNPQQYPDVDLSDYAMKLADGPYYPFRKKDKPIISEENKGFRWISEIDLPKNDSKWLWKGLILAHGITLFSALYKSGKTTLLYNLFKAMDGSSDSFLGQEVHQETRILVATEEDDHDIVDRRDELGLGDNIGIMNVPFTGRPTPLEWAEWIKDVIRVISMRRFDLFVIDTLSKLWPVKDENNAGQVDEAILELKRINRETGCAILLVHHTRKSGGELFTASRGSGSLPANCEMIIEFNRNQNDPASTRRFISAAGRPSDVVDRLVCKRENGRYVLDEKTNEEKKRPAIDQPEWYGILEDILTETGVPLTVAQIQEQMKELRGKIVRKQHLVTRLAELIEEGEIIRTGEGRSADPFLYQASCE